MGRALTRREKAACILRAGGTEQQAADAAGRGKRQLQRWKKDAEFMALVHPRTNLTLGPAAEPANLAPVPDLLGGLPPSKAWVSVSDQSVLGTALHPLADANVSNHRDSSSGRVQKFSSVVAASVLQVVLVSRPERVAEVTSALAAGRLPASDPTEANLPLTLAGLYHVQREPNDLGLLIRAASDFRAFLDVWHFMDQETGVVRCLGDVLWDAQKEFVRLTAATEARDEQTGKDWVYFLKARKLGETTIACAYDAWVLRFRDQNARVHLFSRRDDAARELLAAVKDGLGHLPSWLQLPITRSTTTEHQIHAGIDDRRLAKAYPADRETAVEASCTHGHVDEWARMGDPSKVWQAIEPTMAGSCHIVTTGLGPTNYSSDYWRRCLAGDARHLACFIGALERPNRTEAWLAGQRRGMDEQAFRQEYPRTWQDALYGGGEFVFKARDLDAAITYARGFMTAEQGTKLKNKQPRKYVKAWDIGRHKDAAVGIVVDVTDDVHDVVAYRRLRNINYPQLQHEIETLHRAYPGTTVIEDNAAGAAVRENLNLPPHEVTGFSTTATSKARIIANLEIAIQNWLIRWDVEACPELAAEMRGYQLPDDNVVQDSVIALAIAIEHAGDAHLGRILGVIQV